MNRKRELQDYYIKRMAAIIVIIAVLSNIVYYAYILELLPPDTALYLMVFLFAVFSISGLYLLLRHLSESS